MSKFLGFALLAAIPVFSGSIWAQSLTLSSTTAAPGSTVALNLSFSSLAGSQPAALQWTLMYPSASIATVNVTAGAASTAAGKSVSCSGGAAAYTCIAYGLNSNTISDGVVAVVTATLTSSTSSAPVSMTSALGVSTAGSAIAVSTTGGAITVVAPVSGTTGTTGGAQGAQSTASPATVVRVNAGGAAYADASGNVWSGDTGFTGGSTSATTSVVTGTTTPSLYQTCRWGAFSYQFGVPNGSYTIVLKFAEIYFTTPGSRVFNVSINGAPVLTNFDIVAQAGGALKALDKSFPVTVTNGQISIQFSAGSADQPLVNALEIDAGGSGTTGSSPPTSTSAAAVVRANAGGSSYVDSSGTVWNGDYDFTGGSTSQTSAPVSGTNTPALYQTCRWGTFSYQFPVPNGSYTVTLKFAEIYFTTAGSRMFNVSINGTAVLTNFDIVAQAGSALKAVDKSFPVSATNGQITIQFTAGGADQPLINAIEIDSGSGGTPLAKIPTAVFRADAGGGPYTDASGNLWNQDYDFTGGATAQTAATVNGTTAPALYQTCRWGSFQYTVPVPNGSYTVNLKFAEIYFTSPGSRIFNVSINGAPVLTNFDIVAEAGGAWTALDKSFPVTSTNGQITIQFTAGGADQPLVSAIEILTAN